MFNKIFHSETEEIDFLTSADYSDFTFGPPGGGQYTTTLETTVEVITTTTATTGFTDLYTDSNSPCILQIVYKDELCGFGTEYKGKLYGYWWAYNLWVIIYDSYNMNNNLWRDCQEKTYVHDCSEHQLR